MKGGRARHTTTRAPQCTALTTRCLFRFSTSPPPLNAAVPSTPTAVSSPPIARQSDHICSHKLLACFKHEHQSQQNMNASHVRKLHSGAASPPCRQHAGLVSPPNHSHTVALSRRIQPSLFVGCLSTSAQLRSEAIAGQHPSPICRSHRP